MASKAITFEYTINHKLSIQVRNNAITFDRDSQKVYLTEFKVRPALELTSAEALVHYPDGIETTIAEAVSRVVNVSAKAVPEKPKAGKAFATDKSADNRTIRSAGEITDKKNVSEAAGRLPDIDIEVISDQLNVTSQVDYGGGSFKILTKPAEMVEFITWRQSKKIKVFINNKEIAPKLEIEFIKRIFPQFEMTVKVK